MIFLKSKAHNLIHKKIIQSMPEGVKKAKKISRFKHFKLIILLLGIGLMYYLLKNTQTLNLSYFVNKSGYVGMVFAGFLFAFGFSAPLGIGFFVLSHPTNIILATIIAGIGSMLGDILVFTEMKKSFSKDFQKLKKKKIIKEIENIVEKNKHVLIRHYLVYIFAGIIILSPFPDEIGISMLAGLTTVRLEKLALVSFIAHAFLIFLIFSFL